MILALNIIDFVIRQLLDSSRPKLEVGQLMKELKEELETLESDNHRLRHQAFLAGTVKVETMNLEEQLQVAVACFTPLTFVSEAYDVQSLEALVAPLRAERDRNRNEIEAREQELQRCAF